jgi:N-methylhydantoinase B
LERDPAKVLEDVIDGYVSVERAAKDYGVMIQALDPEICAYAIDWEATPRLRQEISSQRRDWLEEDPEVVRQKFLAGEIDRLDLIRRYGVILDWSNMQLLPESTAQFRAMLKRRTLGYWTHDL